MMLMMMTMAMTTASTMMLMRMLVLVLMLMLMAMNWPHSFHIIAVAANQNRLYCITNPVHDMWPHGKPVSEMTCGRMVVESLWLQWPVAAGCG